VAAVDRMGESPVRLVGHSIAGMLLPAVVTARPHRVVELVYLAAICLHRGERGIDTIPQDRRPSYFEMAAASSDNALLPDFASARVRFFTHLSENAARSAYERLTPQAFGVYLTPSPVGADEVDVAVRYLALDDDRNFSRADTDGFAATAGVPAETLPGDHCVMLSDPAVVVRAL
jgi:pimeloyl-ACP methyl ester carboxylesterase